MNSEPITIYGNGDSVRDYIHIDDVVIAVEQLLKSNIAQGVYNLGSGKGVSVSQIIETLANLSGMEIHKNVLEERRSDVRSIVLDIDKLSRTIEHKPSVELEVGINSMLHAYAKYLAPDPSTTAKQPDHSSIDKAA